jgi:uncharacterized membrane protein
MRILGVCIAAVIAGGEMGLAGFFVVLCGRLTGAAALISAVMAFVFVLTAVEMFHVAEEIATGVRVFRFSRGNE